MLLLRPTPPGERILASAFTVSLTCLLGFASFVAAATDNGNECDCFITNASTSAYYVNHRFFDFRNIDPDYITSPPPPILTSASGTANADVTSSYFTNSAWTTDWTIQNWNNSAVQTANNASILMVNSQNNVYIEAKSSSDPDQDSSHATHLTLRTSRTKDFQSAAEVDSNEANFQYLSARFLARVIGSPGACAGLFTYLSPGTKRPVQEADIEVLTSGPRNVVQYTNQPSVDPQTGDDLSQATVNASLPGGNDWSSWNIYRLDWLPSGSAWFVNGVSVANISFQTPDQPSALILNMWSDGGEWTGNMSVHDEAFLQVQWIEMVYNTSGPYQGIPGGQDSKRDVGVNAMGRRAMPEEHFEWELKGGLSDIEKRHKTACNVVCSIDKDVNSTSSIGTPVVVAQNGGAAASYSQPVGPGNIHFLFSTALCVSFMAIGIF